MKIKFSSMIMSLLRNIFATLEEDIPDAITTSKVGPLKEMNLGFAKQKCNNQTYNKEQDKKYGKKFNRLSQEFANLIPADTFSPAEVQGFLLEHKRFPKQAVAHAIEWIAKGERRERIDKEQ
jgi:chaperone BCS1